MDIKALPARSARRVAVVAAFLLLAGPPMLRAAPAPHLAVLDFAYLDTSGEVDDQSRAHAERLAALGQALRATLGTDGRFRVVAVGAPQQDPCDSDCQLARARAAGAELLLVGAIQKVSTMASMMWIGAFDVATGRRVFYRNLTFRGDTDQAWQRAGDYLAREVAESGLGESGASTTP